jgi:hypothetical protein
MTSSPEAGASAAKRAASAAAPPVYSVAPGTPGLDRDTVAHLWQVSGLGNLTEEQQKARYDWFYLRNPQGDGEISYLHADSEPAAVGFLGVGRRAWHLDGEAMPAGVLVDFVVRPDHRTAAPALTLQRQGRARAQHWAKLLIGLPDVKAVAIFKRLDKHVQFSLPRYVRILRYDGYLERRMPSAVARVLGKALGVIDRLWRTVRLLGSGLKGSWAPSFDARFDRLWSRTKTAGRSIGLRDAAFLSWRFGQQPGFRYRTFAVERAPGELAAYFVCDLKGETLEVKDVLGDCPVHEYSQALLLLANAARREGAHAVSIQVAGDDTLDKALRAAHFVMRDQRPFFAMLGEDVRDKGVTMRWYITQADEDI